MTRARVLGALVLSSALAACSRASPEQQIVNDAAEALGGRDRIPRTPNFAPCTSIRS